MKVIKIGAVWCSGCLVMGPRWKEIEEENPWLKTSFFDFDKDQDKIIKYKIEGGLLPTFVFLDKKGSEFLRLHGEVSKKKLLELISKYKDK